ncbi:hypothetical protein EON67_01005 [archaeon]|nr:MAG: hypothetical protein EON67_01005 [archaeon]
MYSPAHGMWDGSMCVRVCAGVRFRQSVPPLSAPPPAFCRHTARGQRAAAALVRAARAVGR